MQEIEIKINSLKPERIRLNLPESWNELSAPQLLHIAKYWNAWQTLAGAGESLLKAKGILFIKLCNLKNARAEQRLCHQLSFITEHTGVNILDTVNFIFDEITLTKNLIPSIRVGLITTYYGPEEKLKDICIEEFSFAFGFYSRYTRNRQVKDLDLLFATLYRPKNPAYKKDGELKERFNHKRIEQRLKAIRTLPDEIKEAVYLFFHGCVEHLAKVYTEVFRRSTKAQATGGSFIDSILVMSGGKFGAFDDTRRQNLHIILKELNALILENNKQKDGAK